MARNLRAKADYDINISACLAELADMFRPILARGIRLDVESDVGSVGLPCSKETLQNALMLLLRNADDALPMGGVILLSASSSGSARNAYLEISVSDTGIGMPRQTLQRAMEPYFSTKFGGMGGFGLPLVEDFVRAAGGRIHLESESNIGTAARIYLPVRDPSEKVRV